MRIKTTKNIGFQLLSSFFGGYEEELEKVTTSGRLVVWKGGIARNVGLMLHGRAHVKVQKDLDINLEQGELMEYFMEKGHDVRALERAWDGRGRILWEDHLQDDITLNNCMVVQLGRRVIWVAGEEWDCKVVKRLWFWEDSDSDEVKKEWRALIFAYRYKLPYVPLSLPYDHFYVIGWVRKAGRKKVGDWEGFKDWVNKVRGELIFEENKYWDEARNWYPNEGY